MGLEDLLPGSIKLGNSCELTVTQHYGWKLEHPVWDTILPHLRSVTLEDSDHAFVGLPSVLYRADNLVKAALSVGCIGTAAVPVQLYGALARVEELAVHCTDLHAIVPSDFAWRNITLTARNALDLRFDAVLSFAETIPAFCFRYLSLQACCLCPVLQLCPCGIQSFAVHSGAFWL